VGVLNAQRHFLWSLAVGLLAAWFCRWLDTPLPWIIGPLFATAALRMAGADLRCPVAARAAGQWAIGSVLGLYFTPAVMAVLLVRAPWIALAVAFALALGWLSARLLQRLSGVSRATAFFGMALGGASEMAVQGERHGAEAQHVAAAQGMRLMFVVTALPFGLRYWSTHGMQGTPARFASLLAQVVERGVFAPALAADTASAATAGAILPAAPEGGARAADVCAAWLAGIDLAALGGLALLAAATCSVAWLFWRRGMPNAWVLGPLLAAALLAVCGVPVGRVPEWMVRAGQLCIGISLGTRFTPGFLHAAPRFMAAVGICTVTALGLAALFGLALAKLGGLHPATAMLATSPGGIAEMALTARALQLDVPVVTAFHVCRMVVLVLAIGPAFRRLR